MAYNCEEDLEVRVEAQNLAQANNVELRMWSVSNLANFLDIEANGQMIRYNHFNTLPNRLSKELLLHVSQQSIQSYLKYIETPIIERDDRFKQGHLLVVGVSGVGKTTYCLGLLQNHLKKNYPKTTSMHMDGNPSKDISLLKVMIGVQLECRIYQPTNYL